MIGKKNFAIGLILLGSLALPLSFAPAAAADWPIFQQNLNHTGFIVQPANFTPSIWNFNVGAAINSSAAILDETIFFGSTNGNIYAVNLENGSKVWQYNTGGGIDSSPSITNRTLYIGSMDDYLYSLNPSTGGLLWKYKTGGSIESSTTEDSGIVYFGSDDGNIYAINTTDGNLVWNYKPVMLLNHLLQYIMELCMWDPMMEMFMH